MPQVPVAEASTDSRRPYANLLPIVEFLERSGNPVVTSPPHSDGFRLDKSGWTCTLLNPLDFRAINDRFHFPVNVVAFPEWDAIHDRSSWASIEGGEALAILLAARSEDPLREL